MSSLSKLLNFVKNNDSPVVLHDSNTDENFVILELSRFEQFQSDNNVKTRNVENITKKDILNRINKNISLWRKKQNINSKTQAAKRLQEQIDEETDDSESDFSNNNFKSQDDMRSETPVNLTEIAQEKEQEELQKNKEKKANDIPKRENLGAEDLKVEELDQHQDPKANEGNIDSAAISYEELDQDDLK
ncbi:MAG: hypothetical protein ABEJ02_00140 [Candidatus Paceibacteria bacterium]